jgi:hypothetical protein
MNAACNESTRIASADGTPQNEASVLTAKSILAAFKVYFLDLPLTVTNEAISFAAHRFGEHARLVSKLSSCKTAAEMAQAQSIFFDSTVDDYQKRTKMLCCRTSETAI